MIPDRIAEFRRKLFSPWATLAGFTLGFALLVLAGHRVTQRSWHPNFTRFHPAIAPDSMYQPSVNEMKAIVRSQARPDQILVIVGGNSILLGVGQPADRMWTRRLQAALGDRYAVVNLAFRGSGPTDGGAIVAEALRDEYPRQIYLANLGPYQAADPSGIETYRFIVLDAWYKKMLLPWAPRDQLLRAYLADSSKPGGGMERRLSELADVYLRFHDFWNWWSATRFFTFATDLLPRAPLAYRSRARFRDEETDFDTIPLATRFSPGVVQSDMNIARVYTSAVCEQGPDGRWRIRDDARDRYLDDMKKAFPDPLKRRTLILISRNSPYYTRQLPADIRERDETVIRASIGVLESIGYESMDYGSDFANEDFGDRTHLTSAGGAKLAAAVAPKVRAMAEKLGYLQR